MTLDRETVLRGIDEELRTFGSMLAGLTHEELGTATACDGWTVRDVAGHVVGTVVDVSAGRIEGQGTPAVTGRQATERAGASGRELGDELAAALPALTALLGSLPPDSWTGPSFDGRSTLGFAVEAIWYDAYVHGHDIRSALGRPIDRGAGLRCAVHHVAGYLDQRPWRAATLALDGIEPIDIAGGGERITGDTLDFVLAATGRIDPSTVGLDDGVNVYAPDSSATG
ncbi:MAG TPA: maleylpyruvate isomerase family mycothiol-dependent enzyme [Mycobacteriales bacterium]|nr:maleylpyruvate isomerase family mycothiol-dependent enzyme [Mycobacteriales bacterium]